MQEENIRIVHYADLSLGGFAGIIEKRMVLNPVIWDDAKDRTDISHGLGRFYLSGLGVFQAK